MYFIGIGFVYLGTSDSVLLNSDLRNYSTLDDDMERTEIIPPSENVFLVLNITVPRLRSSILYHSVLLKNGKILARHHCML